MTRTLRTWQREAVDAVRAEWASGVTRTAIVAATGLGKSSVIGRLAVDEAKAGGRVLLLAHREELLDQLAATCRTFDPTVPVGIVQAARSQHRRPIVAASVATLRSAQRQAQMRPPPGASFWPTLVIVDECHRAVSDSHMKVLAWAGAFAGTRTLGVTATMSRGDKRGLGDCWQSVALSRDIKFGIDEGLLVRPHGRVVIGEKINLAQAKTSRGDYQADDVGEMISQSCDEIVKAWLEHASERRTIAFVPTVASGEEMRDAFRAQGVAAELVTGTTSTTDRRAMYARLAAGTTRVLVNVFVLVEGFDCPAIECVLMARPTKLPHVYIQAVGRGLRLSPDTGKRDCLVLDVVGASRTQRLMTLIDLHETAVVDTSALDALPCDECGGYLGRSPERRAIGEAAGLEPCSCDVEPGERDPDGGRRRLLGPAAYADVDLFGASELTWLFTRKGVRFIPAGDRFAVLWPDSGRPGDEEATYSAGHCASRGQMNGAWLREGVTLAEGKALAEAWAVAYDPSMSKRSASWRRGKPSPQQVGYAAGLGIRGADTMRKDRLSDEISIVIASRRLDVPG